MEGHAVYVLQNVEGKFYIGVTENVVRRLQDHNSGVSTWTRYRGPWTLQWTSEAMSLSEARKLENYLKKQKGGGGFLKYTGLSRRPTDS